MTPIRVLLLISCCLTLITAASADVVSIPAALDNTLYEDATGSLSNGAGDSIFAGKNGQSLIRRALVEFDVDAAIPTPAIINSVTLTLSVTQAPNSTPRTIGLHTATSAWGEGTSNATTGGGGSGAPSTPGDATWIHTFYNTDFWTTVGGDFTAAASATTSVTGLGAYNWSSPQMAVDVQAWLDDPSGNFGWLVLGDESASQTVRRFGSRENAAFELWPSLKIDYTPIPEPGSVTLAAIGLALAGLAVAGRRRAA